MHHPTLREIRSKSKKSENFWYTFFYGCSSYVVWLCARSGFTPNQLTCTGFALNLLTVIYFQSSSGKRDNVLIAAASFGVAHVLDCADGHLAFVTKTRSERGRWLDATCDVFTSAFIASCFIKLLMVRDLSVFGTYTPWIRTFGPIVLLGSLVNYAVLLHAGQFRSSVDAYKIRPLEAKQVTRLQHLILSHGGEYGNVLLTFTVFAFSTRIGTLVLFLLGFCHLSLAGHRVFRIAKTLAPANCDTKGEPVSVR